MPSIEQAGQHLGWLLRMTMCSRYYMYCQRKYALLVLYTPPTLILGGLVPPDRGRSRAEDGSAVRHAQMRLVRRAGAVTGMSVHFTTQPWQDMSGCQRSVSDCLSLFESLLQFVTEDLF